MQAQFEVFFRPEVLKANPLAFAAMGLSALAAFFLDFTDAMDETWRAPLDAIHARKLL